MTCYIISYDLITPWKNYDVLIKELKSLWARAKICESLWAVKSSKKASEIRDHLKKFMDNNDRLFVVKSWVEAARSNVICTSERLKNNL